MPNWYAIYSSEGPVGKVSVTIYPAGESSVTLTANLGQRQEIGEYRHKLPPATAERVREVIRQSNYAALPQAGPQLPGTASMFIAEGVEDSMPTTDRTFPLRNLPGALRPVVQAMDQVIEQIRDHPYRVLAGDAAYAHPEVSPDAELALRLTLRHRGTAPFEIANPAGAPDGTGVVLMLRVTPDKPAGQVSEDEVTEVQLSRSDIRMASQPGGEFDPPAARAELAPGRELQLRATKRLRLRPGRYRAVITFHSAQGAVDSERGVAGSLSMDSGVLTVR